MLPWLAQCVCRCPLIYKILAQAAPCLPPSPPITEVRAFLGVGHQSWLVRPDVAKQYSGAVVESQH